ncbi:peptidoglycan-binding domain-containing protein [Albibacillus kandeliae]|uniref:peptidoglycan-binding domain-containing protein n=1 Tax=Albibacillus kandeliae TaxID=2174228 RepID=UPI000D68CF81|nr:peptidoglycan-binding domain-containing protein [Albibacillus kandeliae]
MASQMPPAKAKKLQELLNRIVKPRPPLEVDGIIGDKTKDAIKQMQGMAGLKKSGEVDSETAAVIARGLKTGSIEKEQPEYFFKVGSKWIGMTKKEYAAYKKQMVDKLRSGPLMQMRMNLIAAESDWDHFDKQNKDQWFVAFCIETTRGIDLPPKGMITKAQAAYKQCESALSSGDLSKFHKLYPNAEKLANDAAVEMRRYRENMIDGGGNWVTGLTFTKTGAFTFVGVFAAPVAGAALGTGVVASAMIGGAAVSATQSAAGELGNWSAGDKNFSVGGAIKNTIIDGGVGAIVGFFNKGGAGGKNIVEALSARVLPKLAKETGFKLLSSTSLKKATAYLITEGFKKTLEDAVKDVAAAAKGDKTMTIDKFLDNLAVNFMKGAAMGPFGKIIGDFAKKASSKLDSKDKQKIWDVVLNELSKQAKGKTIHIGDINDRAEALVEKIINDQISKNLDQVISEIYDKVSGPMSPAAFEQMLRDKLVSPARAKAMGLMAAQEIKKKKMVPA